MATVLAFADINKVFSEKDTTYWIYRLYKKTELIKDTSPPDRINHLPERYHKIILRATKLTLDKNNQVLKKQNVFQ